MSDERIMVDPGFVVLIFSRGKKELERRYRLKSQQHTLDRVVFSELAIIDEIFVVAISIAQREVIIVGCCIY